MKRKIISSLLLLFAIVGCSSQPTSLEKVVIVPKLHAEDAVDVRIDEKEYHRKDYLVPEFFGVRGRVQTGLIWKRAFVGNGPSVPEFRIKSAVIRQKTEANGYMARFTYAIDGELFYRGKIHPIHTEATEMTIDHFQEAMWQVIEKGVKDVTDQCRSIINRGQ